MGSKSKGIQKAQQELKIAEKKLNNAAWCSTYLMDNVNQARRNLLEPIYQNERRRRAFKERYDANPCNFLPARMLHELYKLDVNQKQLETLAGQAILGLNKFRQDAGAPLILWPVAV